MLPTLEDGRLLSVEDLRTVAQSRPETVTLRFVSLPVEPGAVPPGVQLFDLAAEDSDPEVGQRGRPAARDQGEEAPRGSVPVEASAAPQTAPEQDPLLPRLSVCDLLEEGHRVRRRPAGASAPRGRAALPGRSRCVPLDGV